MDMPKLRFQSYTDDWVTHKLGEVCSFSKGKELSKADLSDEGKSCVLYGELYTKYGAVIDKVYSKTTRESNSLVTANKYDVLIPSSGETAIDIACASSLDVDSILIGGDLNILTPKKNIYGHFLSYQINGKRKGELSTLAQGATVTHLYPDSIQKLECYFPSLEEQKEIANFIYKFDKKIQLQQKKIDSLKEQKKGYMQKIFSQELRFKNDDGQEFPEWERKKLKDLATSISYGMNAPAKPYDGENIYIRITDIDEVTRNFIEENKVSPDAHLEEKYLLKNGDILFARTGASVGKSFLFKTDVRKFYFAGFLIRLQLKEGIISNYIYQNTLTEDYSSWIKVMSMRSGQPGVNAEEYGQFEVQLPCLGEQKKISEFLSSFDKKIDLLNEMKNALEQQKQALMQQMFI